MKERRLILLLCIIAWPAYTQNRPVKDRPARTPDAAQTTAAMRLPPALRRYYSYRDTPPSMRLRPAEVQGDGKRFLHHTLIAGTILAVTLSLLLFWLQIVKYRKDKIIQASQKALIQEKLKNAELHEEQLQRELTSKSKELTTVVLNIIQKNQLLEELDEKINEIRKESGEAACEKLHGLQHLIKHSFNLDKSWNDFRLYFEKVHVEFFKALSTRFPDLSNKELRLCALLKLNLTTKEMADILGISPDSVKMARYRLRKKLSLASENDLATFMIRLEKDVSEKNG